MRPYFITDLSGIRDRAIKRAMLQFDIKLQDLQHAAALSTGGADPTAESQANAEYVVMSHTGALSKERKLAANTPISLADGGANGSATLSLTFDAVVGQPDASAAIHGANNYPADSGHKHIFPDRLQSGTDATAQLVWSGTVASNACALVSPTGVSVAVDVANKNAWLFYGPVTFAYTAGSGHSISASGVTKLGSDATYGSIYMTPATNSGVGLYGWYPHVDNSIHLGQEDTSAPYTHKRWGKLILTQSIDMSEMADPGALADVTNRARLFLSSTSGNLSIRKDTGTVVDLELGGATGITGFAVPNNAFAVTPVEGVATTAIRTDATLRAPNLLQSLTATAGDTITMTSDGTTILLTPNRVIAEIAASWNPFTNNARTLGSTSKRWSTVNSVLGNFSGTLTGVAGTFSGLITGTAGATLAATSGNLTVGRAAGGNILFNTANQSDIGASATPGKKLWFTDGDFNGSLDVGGSLAVDSGIYVGLDILPASDGGPSIGYNDGFTSLRFLNGYFSGTVQTNDFLSTGSFVSAGSFDALSSFNATTMTGQILFLGASLRLKDIGVVGPYYAIFSALSSPAATADHTIGVNLSNADRIITFTGNPTLADWFDQSVKTTASPTFVSPVATTAFLPDANGGASLGANGLGFSEIRLKDTAAAFETTIIVTNVSGAGMAADNQLTVKLPSGGVEELKLTGNGHPGRPLDYEYTSVGNTALTETDLRSYTIAADALNNTGESVWWTASGTFANTASTNKRIKMFFGGTEIFNSGLLAAMVAGGTWSIRGECSRLSSTTQKCMVTMQTDNATYFSSVVYSAPTETLTANVVLRLTGNGTNAGDVTAEMWKVRWEPGV